MTMRNEKTSTEFNRNRIHEFILVNGRVPSVKEVMEITGTRYDYASRFRRRVLREFPTVNVEEIVEQVKALLLERIKDKSIDNTSLVRLMPWVAPRLEAEEGDPIQITHLFKVVPPDAEMLLLHNQQTPVLMKSGENESVENEGGELTE